ncbi:hypothetical protein EVA_18524 [gut metagenome]|uniref:Uncharacterized protein n=1 Tax=gut metagenome TaxID=749906 RepID=J9C0M2_9ZZZZ
MGLTCVFTKKLKAIYARKSNFFIAVARGFADGFSTIFHLI